jgi:ribosomal protein L35AE/L33A
MKPLYRIQERENPQANWMTIDSFTSKAKAQKYCKEYQAYKPTSEFRVLAQVLN